MKNPRWTTEVHIELLTPAELATVPSGTLLFDIFGMPVIKGQDKIDGDTRGGYTAYGYMLDDGDRVVRVFL